MSGLEVAGVVLGAFPLAIAALEQRRDLARRLGLWQTIRPEYFTCKTDLGFHRATLTSNLRQLLLPLVVDDTTVKNLLANPGAEGWRDESVDRLLKERLHEKYELYFEYIKGMERVMEEVKEELAADSDAVQKKLNTPKIVMSLARVKNAWTKDGREFQRYKLKFSNSETTRKQLFAQLKDYNDKLEKLLTTADRDAELAQQRLSRKRAADADSGMCSFWVPAARLFRALASAWNCACREQHCARLLLKHRTSRSSEFDVLFATHWMECWEVHTTKIKEGDEENHSSSRAVMTRLDSLPTRQPTHRQERPLRSALRSRNQETCVELLSPPPSITITSFEANPQLGILRHISTLCISPSHTKDPCWGYLLEEDCRYYIHTVSRHTTDKFTPFTLREILRGGVRQVPTRRQRYSLSLTLASSFLQLLDTPWLPISWNPSDILFYPLADNPSIIPLDKPYLGRDIHSPAPGGIPEAKRPPILSQCLSQLGILLLELCFGKLLSEQDCRKEWRAGDTEAERRAFDEMAARSWLYEVEGEAGADYSEAVAWCLGMNRPEGWRRDMWVKVVQPLQRCRDMLSGGGVIV